jgi:hypothetical protein
MKGRLISMAITSLALCCRGQGTFQITFDGPPLQPPGTSYTFQNYYESGMSFTPINPDASFAGFGRTKGGGQLAGVVPDNGTAYLQAAVSDSLSKSEYFFDHGLQLQTAAELCTLQ